MLIASLAGFLLCAPVLSAAPTKALPRPKGGTDILINKDRGRLLIELRKRNIIAREAREWTPEQYTRLLRLREAEALGAFGLLRLKRGTLRGFAVEHGDEGYGSLWLTEEGYQRFIFYLSQDARKYFETKGAQARSVFETRSIKGDRLFTKRGALTQEGIAVYHRIQRKLPVFWRYADGRVSGTVRPPASVALSGGSAVSAHTPPAQKSAKYENEAEQKAEALLQSGYVEIFEEEVRFLSEKTKMNADALENDSSLQIIQEKQKTFYLLSPSDPMMALVTRRRSVRAEKGAAQDEK